MREPLKVGVQLLYSEMRIDDYGALGLAFKAATTPGMSYARVERYARLWTNQPCHSAGQVGSWAGARPCAW